jgi:hypothetical protein
MRLQTLRAHQADRTLALKASSKAKRAAVVAPSAIDPRERGRRDRGQEGPATKYDPSMCETIIGLGRLGKSKTQCASNLGIARSTFDAWLGQHEEFREAWDLADTHAQAIWEEIGFGGWATSSSMTAHGRCRSAIVSLTATKKTASSNSLALAARQSRS